MSKDFTRPEEQNRTLQERIGDNSIERGIPTDLNVKSKSTVRNVVLLLAGLGLSAFIIFSLWTFFSDDDETAKPQKQEEQEIRSDGSSDKIANEQREIEENRLELAATTASEAAASQPEMETVSAEQMPMTATGTYTASEPQDIRLEGSVMVSPDSGGAGVGGAVASVSTGGADEVSEAPIVETDDSGAAGLAAPGNSTPASGSGNMLTNRLKPGVYSPSVAQEGGSQEYTLKRGTAIRCLLSTKIVTTHPGLTRCQVAKDVYSGDGKTLLIERGSTVIGEQTSALTNGQARVFALWDDLVTTSGIRVSLGSPGGDSLGAAGHPAKVKTHFWKRIGGAVMISMIDDVVGGYINRRRSGNSEVTFENTTEAAQDLATEVLKNNINIPPTGYVNQGTEITIFVARDVDFSHVFENVSVHNIY